MILHSVLIPHRGRLDALRLCLWSITESARDCNRTDYEIVLANAGPVPDQLRDTYGLVAVQLEDHESGPFPKSLFLNRAIEASRGKVLTFLDCDMLAGPKFMDAAARLARVGAHRLTRLCYRVRTAPEYAQADLAYPGTRRDRWLTWFNRYPHLRRGFEAYSNPDWSPGDGQEPAGALLFGNSQFTIRRDALGDLRYDEAYVGRGFQDLDLTWRLWKRHMTTYHAELADGCLLHMPHDHEPDWQTEELTAANLARYRQAKKSFWADGLAPPGG